MGDLTPGYIYIIESESAQQDWLHDPDNIVIGNFTEGTHYCKIAIPRGWRIQAFTGAVITTMGGSVQYSRRTAKRAYVCGCNGILTTIANANLVNKFIMSDRHTSGVSATYKQHYLIVYHGLNSSNLVPKFINNKDVERSYCQGITVNWSRVWTDIENQLERVNFRFASVWKQ